MGEDRGHGVTPVDKAGDDPIPRAGSGLQGLNLGRLTGLLNGTYAVVAAGTHCQTLIRKLNVGTEAVASVVLGDSTGGTVSAGTQTEFWFYKAHAALAAKFPAYTATHLTWNDTNQAYDPPVTVQTGTAGDRYVRVSSGTAYLTAPDSATTSITGDIDVRVKAALDTWTAPGSQSALASKQDGAGARSWRLELATNGRLVFSNTSDGTTLIDRTSTVAVPFTAGQVGWVRATLDVDNGASGNTCTFYTSTDGTTWTQLGSPVVTASTTSIADTTALNYFPGRTSGGYNPGGAQFYALHVLNGIGGTPVVILDLDVLPASQQVTTLTDYTGTRGRSTTPARRRRPARGRLGSRSSTGPAQGRRSPTAMTAPGSPSRPRTPPRSAGSTTARTRGTPSLTGRRTRPSRMP
jgi:hypothetical protein